MQPDSPDAIVLQALEKARGKRSAREKWLATARAEQLPPPGDWLAWLILAGRGWGKTRTGAEWAADIALSNPAWRIALIAPTFADGRDTMVEGESGLLGIIPAELIDTWNRSMGELILANGSRFKLFSSEESERLRGPQHHAAWADELAAWKRAADTWDQLMFGLRLGQSPRVVVTTTPKPTKLIRALRDAPTTVVTRGSTFDNAANLAPSALATFRAKYEGTRLGRQELFAEVLDDTPGALWTRDLIEAARFEGPLPAMTRIVVAVDPSGSDGTRGDSQGIVVAGLGADGRGYVLHDGTCRLSPEGWAADVARLFHRFGADRVVAERNFGGAMVESVLRAAAPNLPVTLVTASRGKAVRAEPVAALYEQHKISHAEPFPELEDQMAAMTTHGFTGDGSPDRLDALVWAFTELMVAEKVAGYAFLEIARAQNAARGLNQTQAEIQKPTHAIGSMEWAAQQMAGNA